MFFLQNWQGIKILVIDLHFNKEALSLISNSTCRSLMPTLLSLLLCSVFFWKFSQLFRKQSKSSVECKLKYTIAKVVEWSYKTKGYKYLNLVKYSYYNLLIVILNK